MRNAAMVLGLIGGIIGLIVGLVGYGAVMLAEVNPDITDRVFVLENPQFLQIASFLAPLLAIAGGAMAKARALWGGIAMLVACALFYYAFGFNLGTMFPIGFTGLGGVLAIAAGKPDEEKAHF